MLVVLEVLLRVALWHFGGVRRSSFLSRWSARLETLRFDLAYAADIVREHLWSGAGLAFQPTDATRAKKRRVDSAFWKSLCESKLEPPSETRSSDADPTTPARTRADRRDLARWPRRSFAESDNPESGTGRERLPPPSGWMAGVGVSRGERASLEHRPRRERGGADDGGSGAARVPRRRLVAITRPDPHQHVPNGPATAVMIIICISPS